MAKRTQVGTGAAADRIGDRVGYARVSTRDQTVALQLDALHTAGCVRVFEETAFGVQRDRPQLAAALDYMRAGDTLVVWKLVIASRSLQGAAMAVAGAGHKLAFVGHEVPDFGLLDPHAVQHAGQLAKRRLPQAVILDQGTDSLEVDARRPQQPQQRPLHHRAPVCDADLLAQLREAPHEREAGQAGRRRTDVAALLGDGEAGHLDGAPERDGAERCVIADGLHREAASELARLGQDHANGSDDGSATTKAEHDMASVPVIRVGLKVVDTRFIASLQAVNLVT
jgi:Resolvase, N terminal domain